MLYCPWSTSGLGSICYATLGSSVFLVLKSSLSMMEAFSKSTGWLCGQAWFAILEILSDLCGNVLFWSWKLFSFFQCRTTTEEFCTRRSSAILAKVETSALQYFHKYKKVFFDYETANLWKTRHETIMRNTIALHVHFTFLYNSQNNNKKWPNRSCVSWQTDKQ